MQEKRENEDVDLTWARIPSRFVWRRDRTAPGGKRQDWKTKVPQLLIGLGPENSQNLDSAWVREKDKMFATTGEDKRENAKVAEIISENKANKRLAQFEKDLQRIKSSGDESIRALIGVRKKVNTDVGHLKLLFEVLNKAVGVNDRSLAFDVLWAIENDSLYKKVVVTPADTAASAPTEAVPVAGSANAKEKYKEEKIKIEKMDTKGLQRECEIRGLPVKGNKKDLQKVLLPRIKDECEGKVPPPSAEAIEAAASDGKDKKKSKKDKDGKKSSKKEKEDKKSTKSSKSSGAPEGISGSIEENLVATYLEQVKTATMWRDELSKEELIRMQLTDMSHLLPPLSPFTQKFKLDMWQKQVLRYVDDKKSVLVCAPTSSGKTVISSYVASQGRRLDLQTSAPARAQVDDDDELVESSDDEEDVEQGASGVDSVLFVVPSEPLVWQVAAHFAKCAGLDSKVGLVTDIMTYVPSQRAKHYKGAHKAPPRVTVGTPLALESALTKIRGFVTHKEMHDQEDRGQPAGGFQYKWVVFDEVHALQEDSPDGRALQRLIKMLNCNFLALSATVGNAEQLRGWFESVKGSQIVAETVDAVPDSILNCPLGKIDLSFLQEKCLTTGKTKDKHCFSKEDSENILTVLDSMASSRDATTKFKMEINAMKKGVDSNQAMKEGLESVGKNFPREAQKLLDYFNPQRHNSVKLQVHEGRFINLQRHVWAKHDGSDSMALTTLHPLAAVTMDFLRNRGFEMTSLPMTSRDSIQLWNHMKDLYPMEAIQYLDPLVNFPPSEGRITLEATKTYEHNLKTGLHELVHTFPTETEKLLQGFTLVDPPKEFNVYEIITHLNKVDPHSGLSMLPALVFHLDIFELINRFHELLTGLEEAQHKKYPDYYESVLAKLTQTNMAMVSALRGCSTDEEKERVMRDFVNMGSADLEQPHPDFVLSRGVSRQEFDSICEEVNKEDKFGSNASKHALLRALRRGIGVIIEEVTFQAYRRAVMRLATQGKLAVVFSDRSLAFGVNMPFRSCVFCGDMGNRLDALMQQQMSGRAGRRGLDTQGHLVYAGTSAVSIQNLMLAKVSDIHGTEPCYHTQFLTEVMSGFVNPDFFKNQTELLGDASLYDYNHGNAGKRENFNTISRDFLMEMEFIEECDVCAEEVADGFVYSFREFAKSPATPSGFKPRAPYNAALMWAMWELRSFPAESVAIGAMLPFLVDDMYRNNQNSAYWVSVEGQLEFIVMLLQIIDRTPITPGNGQSAIRDHPFVSNENVKARDPLRARLIVMNDKMREHQEKILTMMDGRLENKESLLLPVPIGEPLDDKLFTALREDTTAHVLPEHRQEVKERLWHLGVILRTLHNCLYVKKDKYGSLAEENKFHVLSTCMRKCFQRIKYVSRDLIQETIDVPNACSFEMEGGVDDRLAEYKRSMGALKDSSVKK